MQIGSDRKCAALASDRNDILFEGKERKGKERREEREEEKETRKPRRDPCSVRKEQTMEFPFAFGYVWNGREGGGPGWKKDGEDESEALQLGGVVSN